ncbi:keratin, type I cytoskeletal 19-like [Pelobates fuscus]|uniref:keratin, type I cytoskeletal 19-like n=1 Tax=Pelobates fuscus TaxID=191477 RepID=UPI002FE4D8D0
MSNYSLISYKRTGSVERAPTLSSSVVKTRYAGSVYAGAGGYGTKISTSSGYGGSLGLGSSGSTLQISTNSDLLLTGNEKATMQNLNDRLASYLDRVRSLEQANSQLEVQIKEWYTKNAVTPDKDYNAYYQVIEDLKDKILASTLDNARILLEIDNSKLAADDFRLKFENELALRLSVEKDIGGLRKVIDDLSITRSDIEIQIESLQEELAFLKKNHEDEINVLRNQVGGTVNVEVDAAPPVDLAKLLSDMRLQCETLVEKNRQEAKDRFDVQVQEVSVQIDSSQSELQTYRTTITELQRSIQGLEIELQAELSKKNALSATLDNVNAQYAAQLSNIQTTITNFESQLVQIRSDIGRQTQEYELLLNIKLRLEMEIATYRRLLEGEDENWQLDLEEKLREQNRSRKIKTIVEEVVDGKVVSSEIKEVEEHLPSVLVPHK